MIRHILSRCNGHVSKYLITLRVKENIMKVRGICQIKVEYIHSGSQQKLKSKNWQSLKFRSDNQLLKALTNLIILLYDLHFVLNFEVFQLPQHNVHFAKNLTCDNL